MDLLKTATCRKWKSFSLKGKKNQNINIQYQSSYQISVLESKIAFYSSKVLKT